MHTYHAACVLAVRTCLAPKAWRIGAIANRQIGLGEDLAAVQVDQRHFGSRDQVQGVLLDEEGFFGELGKLSRAFHGLGKHEEGCEHLQVAVLGRHVEHE